MKKILAILLVFMFAFSAVSCKIGSKYRDGAKKSVNVGDETVMLPEKIESVGYSLPSELELKVPHGDGDIDLYSASYEELEALSEKSCDRVFSSLQDKQDIANAAASVLGELYPEKEILKPDIVVTIKSNREAKCFICCAEGSDGGKACLAIENKTGKIFMTAYFE